MAIGGVKVVERAMRLLLIILIFAVAWVAPHPLLAQGKSMARAVKQGFPDPGTKWAYQRVKGHSRAGKRSERFEIRHGDCGSDHGWSDCESDRQRTERAENPKNRMQKIGAASWYGWSIFLDPSFQDIGPANTTIGQLKLTGWREPLWFFNAREGGIRVMFPHQSECWVGDIAKWRGRWVDIVVFADYRFEASGNDMFAVWIDGKKVCAKNRPLVTREMKNRSKGTTYVKYGIYNSYVSRWLDRNKRKPVQAVGFSDRHSKSGLVLQSASQTPFAYDWGVRLPTQIVFYDEMRYGKSRNEVDIRILEEAGARPVD